MNQLLAEWVNTIQVLPNKSFIHEGNAHPVRTVSGTELPTRSELRAKRLEEPWTYHAALHDWKLTRMRWRFLGDNNTQVPGAG
jgi:hypothetical protein